MSSPGNSVLIEDGYRAVKSDGTFALFNADGQCPECCLLSVLPWSFNDFGLIADGHNGTRRDYTQEDMPAHPLWEINRDGQGVQANFEPDWQCNHYNANAQYGTARGGFLLTRPASVRFDYSAQVHKWQFTYWDMYFRWDVVGLTGHFVWGAGATQMPGSIGSDYCNIPWYDSAWSDDPPHIIQLEPDTYTISVAVYTPNLSMLRWPQFYYTLMPEG